MKTSLKAICYLLVLFLGASSQTFNITGTVVDSLTSQGISGALIKIVEVPKCSTRTSANGSFTLTYSTGINPTYSSPISNEEISFSRHSLIIGSAKPSSQIDVEVYDCKGAKTRSFQKRGNTIPCADLWQTPGWYQIKVNTDGKEYSISGMGLNDSFLPNAQKDQISTINDKEVKLAKASATYTLFIYATGYVTKLIPLTNISGSIGNIKLLKPIKVSTGTGTNYVPLYIKDVTGGGAFPDTTNGYTCNCDGTGATDATLCLRNAANSARTQKKPLLIPYTSGYYKVSSQVVVYTSIIGVGGMPTIKQFGMASGTTIIVLGPGMTGWVYNLHLIGTYVGTTGWVGSDPSTNSEWSHCINVGSVNGVTIKGNYIENAMGDNISTDITRFDNGNHISQNVIVENNTLKNPYRCNVGFTFNSKNWVVMNNIMDKQANFVSGIDFEPEGQAQVFNVEVGYNKFIMNNRTINPSRGADGIAVSGWNIPEKANIGVSAGGNYYIHHNYGTFGTGMTMFGPCCWGYMLKDKNAEGQNPPP